MYYLYALCVGYLFGCFNLAFILARVRGSSIIEVGNGNPGASNVSLNFGIKAGVCVAICDILKAFLPSVVMQLCFPAYPFMAVCTGCAAVIGHMFPFYMRFKGGKGFASFIGMLFAVDWRVAVIVIPIAILLALFFDYIVVATFTIVIVSPIMVFLFAGCNLDDCYSVYCMCGLAVLIVCKHHPNIKQIVDNTEPHISSLWKKPAGKC